MKILVAVDGSDYTKRMLAYWAAHDEWLGDSHEYTLLTVIPAVPPRAASGSAVVVAGAAARPGVAGSTASGGGVSRAAPIALVPVQPSRQPASAQTKKGRKAPLPVLPFAAAFITCRRGRWPTCSTYARTGRW